MSPEGVIRAESGIAAGREAWEPVREPWLCLRTKYGFPHPRMSVRPIGLRKSGWQPGWQLFPE